MGRASALRLAQEGALLGVTDINADGLDETVAALREAGNSPISVVGDITESATVESMVGQASQSWGGVDVLVNCAGINMAKPIEECTEEDFMAIMKVNCFASLLTVKHALPEMRKRQGGSIINISSVGGLVGAPGLSMYCASKGAVVNMTKAIAVDLAPTIRCNVVCPGVVDTPMAKKLLTDYPDREAAMAMFTAKQLIKRFGEPGEVASVVAFLASNDAAFMTGSVIAVDAGWSAW